MNTDIGGERKRLELNCQKPVFMGSGFSALPSPGMTGEHKKKAASRR
jgi:hypothetical protein